MQSLHRVLARGDKLLTGQAEENLDMILFMRIEAYRMFEYDAEKMMYRCFYAHDPGVDLMKFMTCFNVRSVPGVRMHLLDSYSDAQQRDSIGCPRD